MYKVKHESNIDSTGYQKKTKNKKGLKLKKKHGAKHTFHKTNSTTDPNNSANTFFSWISFKTRSTFIPWSTPPPRFSATCRCRWSCFSWTCQSTPPNVTSRATLSTTSVLQNSTCAIKSKVRHINDSRIRALWHHFHIKLSIGNQLI